MADETTDIPAMDYEQHERTFAAFVELTKLGILAIVTTLICLVVIAFTESTFFKLIGFVVIFLAYIVAFAEFRLKSKGLTSLGLVALSLLMLVVAVA